MKVFFLDTNILLQCKDLKELPWDKIQSKGSLLLVLPRSVQKELDRLKSDGNSRRAKRARKATTFLREIILSQDSITDIRVSKPKVQLKIVPKLHKKTNLPDLLDLDSPDDCILADMIAYKELNPKDEVAVLTQDINLLTTAKTLSLSYYPIPDEWLLPPESDPRDKRIVELEDQLKILQNTQPNIEIGAFDEKRKPIELLQIEVTRYKNLELDELNELVELVKAKYPMANSFEEDHLKSIVKQTNRYDKIIGVTRKYEPASKEDIEKYKNEHYPNWVKAVENYFSSLPYSLELPSRIYDITFSINNIGTLPVDDLVLEFSVDGGLLFCPPNYNRISSYKPSLKDLPNPPKVPEGQIIEVDTSPFAALKNLSRDPFESRFDNRDLFALNSVFNFSDQIRDKNTFYWKYDKPTDYCDRHVFECEEFLHHVRPEIFKISLFVPMDTQQDEQFTLKCRVVGKNLPEPTSFKIPVEVKFDYRESIEIAKSIFE